MAILTTVATGVGIANEIGGLFGGRSSERAARDEIKDKLIEIGVRRSAWTNFNSNSVKAGNDLLNFLLSNPYAVDEFNLKFSGKNITRRNVENFINNVSLTSGGSTSGGSTSGAKGFLKSGVGSDSVQVLIFAAIAAGGLLFFISNN